MRKLFLNLYLVIIILVTAISPAIVKADTTGDTVISGEISAVAIYDISFSATVTYDINPNAELAEDYFVSSPISFANNGQQPIELGISYYQADASNTMIDVLKNDTNALGTRSGTETDEELRELWYGLGKTKSASNIGLYLKDDIVTSKWREKLISTDIAFANIQSEIAASGVNMIDLGSISGGDAVLFSLYAYHGLAFNSTSTNVSTITWNISLAN